MPIRPPDFVPVNPQNLSGTLIHKKAFAFLCRLNPISKSPDFAPDLPVQDHRRGAERQIRAAPNSGGRRRHQTGQGRGSGDQTVNRHSTMTHYQRPTVTQLQEGGTGGEISEILFFSAKSKRRPSLIYSMQIIPVCLSIVARRKGVSATRRGGLNWTPISLLVGHPCKLFHSQLHHNLSGTQRKRT